MLTASGVHEAAPNFTPTNSKGISAVQPLRFTAIVLLGALRPQERAISNEVGMLCAEGIAMHHICVFFIFAIGVF